MQEKDGFKPYVRHALSHPWTDTCSVNVRLVCKGGWRGKGGMQSLGELSTDAFKRATQLNALSSHYLTVMGVRPRETYKTQQEVGASNGADLVSVVQEAHVPLGGGIELPDPDAPKAPQEVHPHVGPQHVANGQAHAVVPVIGPVPRPGRKERGGDLISPERLGEVIVNNYSGR